MHSKIIFNPLLKHYWWLIALCISMSLASFSAQAELTLEDYLSKEPMPGKFNLCAYGSHEFEELEQRLREVIVGKKVDDLENYFMNMDLSEEESLRILFDEKKQYPDSDLESILKFQFIKPADKLEKKTGHGRYPELKKFFPIGERHYIVYACPVLDINANQWGIHILSDEEGVATRLELDLFYKDKNFLLRNILIQRDRLDYYGVLLNAITQMWVPESISRDEFKKRMQNIGYWFSNSCNEDSQIDIFVPEPPPPDSLLAMYGFDYWRFDGLISLNAEFSDNDILANVKSVKSWGPQQCKASQIKYAESVEKWVFKHYPHSWYANYRTIVKQRKLQRQKLGNTGDG